MDTIVALVLFGGILTAIWGMLSDHKEIALLGALTAVLCFLAIVFPS